MKKQEFSLANWRYKIMEIGYFAREMIVFGLAFFFIGSIFYSLFIADKDITVKKH